MNNERESFELRPLICFDMDGTLVDGEGRIHPRDIEILAGDGEFVFVPATGRPLHAVKRTFARNGLFVKDSLPFPLILQNGSLLYRANEGFQAYFPFDADTQEQLLRVCLSFPEVTFLLLDSAWIHVLWPHHFALEAAASYDFVLREFDEISAGCNFSKVMCMSEDAGALREVAQVVSGAVVEAAYSMATILEFTPPGVNKGSGLAHLKEALGLGDVPVYAAGDGENDLALFEQARAAFAPSHSPPEIQARAGQVIDVKKDGLLGEMVRRIKDEG